MGIEAGVWISSSHMFIKKVTLEQIQVRASFNRIKLVVFSLFTDSSYPMFANEHLCVIINFSFLYLSLYLSLYVCPSVCLSFFD